MRKNNTFELIIIGLLGLSIMPMAITPVRAQAVAVNGYSVADFATGFVTGNCGSTGCTIVPGCSFCVGPLGLGSDPFGNLYVADIISGNIYKFSRTLPPPYVASSSNEFVSSSVLSPFRPHGMTFGKDGNLYVNLVRSTDLPDGELVRLSPSGTSYQVVATGLDWPSGLASDPLSGDLFLSETAGPGTNNIYRVSVGTGTVTVYANTAADGLAFGPDGTLYAATPGGVSNITGTNKPQPATVTFITSLSCPDGVATSLDEGKPFLYTNNSCDGTITKLDLHTLAQTNIVSGGSRGDFVTVGSDDCLYATQTDRVLLVANGVGNCPLPPLGPLFQHHRSVEDQAFHNSAGVPITTGDSVPRNTTVFDTAQVAEVNGIVPTGNVTYTFYSNSACSGSGASQTVKLSGGLVPDSPLQPSLAIGQYSFQANYTGDTNYFPSTSSCDDFTAALVTTLLSNSHSVSIPLGGLVVDGVSVHGSAIVAGNGTTPIGSVTYTFFNNGACSGTGTTQTVNLSNGLAPNSMSHGPLGVGLYSLSATYSGDSNYPQSTSSCEFFTVLSLVTTALFTSSGGSIPTGGSVPRGTSVFDTAQVAEAKGVVPTGHLTYTFFNNGACSGSGTRQTVNLTSAGAVPNSAFTGPLSPGSYSFNATYGGDSNYPSSTSPCEQFNVAKDPSSTGTVVFDASTKMAWSGAETAGASAFDTATVTTSGAVVATGSVSYTLFTNSACFGSGTSAGTVGLTSTGAVPNSNTERKLAGGFYGFIATYSGDSNYLGSTGPCEPFSVGRSSTATTVFDASTKMPWPGGESAGASAFDTATVTTSGTIVATGTVSYTFFANNACFGSGTSAGTVGLTSTGSALNSTTEGPLPGGLYSFMATYSGDPNYAGSTSSCEPFTVLSSPVGGTNLPIDKLALLAPYLGLVSALLIGVVAFTLKRVRAVKKTV